MVHVKLGFMSDKILIFNALKQHKPKNITVKNEFSASLKSTADELEKKAFELRKENDDMKTKVLPIQGGLNVILLIKRKTDKYFNQWKPDNEYDSDK